MFKILKYYILCLFIFTNTKVVCQNKKNINSNKPLDSIEILLNEGIKYQEKGEFIKSIDFFQRSLKEYEKKGNLKKIGDCNSYIAISYYYQSNYKNALTFFENSKANYSKAGDIKGLSFVLNNIGGIYFSQGDYIQALNHFTKVIKIKENRNDLNLIAATSQNIGNIYSQIGDYDNALIYFSKSFKLFSELKKHKETSQSLNSKGLIYIKRKDFDNARKNIYNAFDISKKQNDIQPRIEVLSNIGLLLYNERNINDAINNYQTCLDLSQKTGNRHYIGESNIGLGKSNLILGQTELAIKQCMKGFNISKEIKSIFLQKDACDCLYNAYKKNGNTKLALNYFEKSNLLKDSLHSKETANQMMNMEFQNKELLDSITYVKKEHTLQLKHKEEVQQKENQRNIIIVSLGFILLLAIGLYNRLNFVKKSKKELQFQKDRSDKLLLNILPEEIAEELKQKGAVNARDFNLVTVLFSDFKSFTQTAEKMTPIELVEEINICFKAFDHISEKYNIEKIKTIGDSYMATGGVPVTDKYFLINTVFAAIEMQEFMINRKTENDLIGKLTFEMRIGIHAGPIVAGVVGVKKFQYDVWGDTVNTASRMESNGEVGKVNISENLYLLIKDSENFIFHYRGEIEVKGKGKIKMFFVERSN